MRLALHPAAPGTPVRPTSAWLFPSTDTAGIIAALARQGIDVAATRIVPLPVGLFVLPAGTGDLAGARPPAGAIPYGRLAANVFAPVDAVPNATVTADEWGEMFPTEKTFVWHPAMGPFRVATEGATRGADLILAPAVDGRRWDRAVPGVAFNGRIVSLLPERALGLDDLWGGASREIGAERPSLASLPPLPGEWTLPAVAGWGPRSRWIALGALLLIAGALLALRSPLSGGEGVALPSSLPDIPWGGLLWLVGLMALVIVPLRLLARNDDGRADGGDGPGGAMPATRAAIFAIRPEWVLGLGLLALFLLVLAGSTMPVLRSLAFGLGYVFGITLLILMLDWVFGGDGLAGLSTGGGGATGAKTAGRIGPAGRRVWWPALPSWGTPPRWLLEWQQTLARAFESRHEREIRRLLHLLHTDPDAGLRFAVPLAGAAGRGIVPPAAGLSEQEVDFGAKAGGAAAFLVVSGAHREALALRYRALANREIGLGRHRRAAYIFDRLLGDPTTAARTLLDGGHFREAAVLYEEKLGRPQEAAEAYERGGLFSEAILRYERTGNHEKVGDVATLLGQDEKAEVAYRRAVDARILAHDPLGAARILESKLGAIDEAIDRLTGSWPDSPQAVRCVTEAFRHLGRLGRHRAARDLVGRVARDGRLAPGRARQVFGILPTLARTYPDETTRRLTADQTRLLAADALLTVPADGVGPVMAALRFLEPADRLLDRDSRRYGRDRRRKPAAAARVDWLLHRGTIALPAGRWTSLAGCGRTLVVAGHIGRQIAVARCVPGEDVQVATDQTWFAGNTDDAGNLHHPCLLAVSERHGRVVIQMPFGFGFTASKTLPAFHGHGPLVVGSHPAFATRDVLPYVLGMAYSDDATFDLLRCRIDQDRQADWIRERYDAGTDRLLGTWLLPPGVIGEEFLPVVGFAGDRMVVERGDTMFVHSGDITSQVEMPESVLRLSPCRYPLDPCTLAVSFAEGGVVMTLEAETPPMAFGAGLAAPLCRFLTPSILVAAAKARVELYHISGGKATLLATHRDPGFEPVAIASFTTGGPTCGVAMLDVNGALTLFEVRVPVDTGGVFWAATSVGTIGR